MNVSHSFKRSGETTPKEHVLAVREAALAFRNTTGTTEHSCMEAGLNDWSPKQWITCLCCSRLLALICRNVLVAQTKLSCSKGLWFWHNRGRTWLKALKAVRTRPSCILMRRNRGVIPTPWCLLDQWMRGIPYHAVAAICMYHCSSSDVIPMNGLVDWQEPHFVREWRL